MHNEDNPPRRIPRPGWQPNQLPVGRRRRRRPGGTVSDNPKDALGRYGERAAARHLIADGMTILDRNWRCEHGELDIILRDLDDSLVFVEVKTRRAEIFGPPAAAVTPAKARRIRQLASLWMSRSGIHVPEVRFDVIGVRTCPDGGARIEHLRGVF